MRNHTLTLTLTHAHTHTHAQEGCGVGGEGVLCGGALSPLCDSLLVSALPVHLLSSSYGMLCVCVCGWVSFSLILLN